MSNKKTIMGSYKARVIDTRKSGEIIEISFVYYGGMNIHCNRISPTSSRYERAKLVREGDDVYASPRDYNKIYRFKTYGRFKRWYKRLILKILLH